MKVFALITLSIVGICAANPEAKPTVYENYKTTDDSTLLSDRGRIHSSHPLGFSGLGSAGLGNIGLGLGHSNIGFDSSHGGLGSGFGGLHGGSYNRGQFGSGLGGLHGGSYNRGQFGSGLGGLHGGSYNRGQFGSGFGSFGGQLLPGGLNNYRGYDFYDPYGSNGLNRGFGGIGNHGIGHQSFYGLNNQLGNRFGNRFGNGFGYSGNIGLGLGGAYGGNNILNTNQGYGNNRFGNGLPFNNLHGNIGGFGGIGGIGQRYRHLRDASPTYDGISSHGNLDRIKKGANEHIIIKSSPKVLKSYDLSSSNPHHDHPSFTSSFSEPHYEQDEYNNNHGAFSNLKISRVVKRYPTDTGPANLDINA